MKTNEYRYLKRWTRPACYMGAEWPDYYSAGVGQSRDSSALERANFDAMLKALGGERSGGEDPQDPGCALSLVRVVRENHWAVGWVEWIAIHETAVETLTLANSIMERFEDYPVIDGDLMSQYEQEEANEVWRDFRASERVKYIRAHRGQFDFRDLRDMLACVRGNYFAGYPSELIR